MHSIQRNYHNATIGERFGDIIPLIAFGMITLIAFGMAVGTLYGFTHEMPKWEGCKWGAIIGASTGGAALVAISSYKFGIVLIKDLSQKLSSKGNMGTYYNT